VPPVSALPAARAVLRDGAARATWWSAPGLVLAAKPGPPRPFFLMLAPAWASTRTPPRKALKIVNPHLRHRCNADAGASADRRYAADPPVHAQRRRLLSPRPRDARRPAGDPDRGGRPDRGGIGSAFLGTVFPTLPASARKRIPQGLQVGGRASAPARTSCVPAPSASALSAARRRAGSRTRGKDDRRDDKSEFAVHGPSGIARPVPVRTPARGAWRVTQARDGSRSRERPGRRRPAAGGRVPAFARDRFQRVPGPIGWKSRSWSRAPLESARPSWRRPSRRRPGARCSGCSATKGSTRPRRSTSGSTPSSSSTRSCSKDKIAETIAGAARSPRRRSGSPGRRISSSASASPRPSASWRSCAPASCSGPRRAAGAARWWRPVQAVRKHSRGRLELVVRLRSRPPAAARFLRADGGEDWTRQEEALAEEEILRPGDPLRRLGERAGAGDGLRDLVLEQLRVEELLGVLPLVESALASSSPS